MILRHICDENGQHPNENSFEAYNEEEKRVLGQCIVYPSENGILFPNRPVRVYVEISGDEKPDALLGAAIAHARHLAVASGKPARIFTQVEPEERDLMTMLSIMGLADDDGLVLMRRILKDGDIDTRVSIPTGSVLVEDALEDEIEQGYFLERYNRLFNEENDLEWLDVLRASKGFKRILLVSKLGMLGEVIFRINDAGNGELIWLQTASAWRRKGIAQRLLTLAFDRLAREGVASVEAEVQAKIPNIVHTLEKAGFKQSKLVYRYPGTDIDP